MKNRNGKANFAIGFIYNAKYDLFEENKNYKTNMATITSREEKKKMKMSAYHNHTLD